MNALTTELEEKASWLLPKLVGLGSNLGGCEVVGGAGSAGPARRDSSLLMLYARTKRVNVYQFCRGKVIKK